MNRHSLILAFFSLLLLQNRPCQAQAPTAEQTSTYPQNLTSVQLRDTILEAIDDVVAEGIRREQMPGCVVTIGRADGIILQKAFGNSSLQPVKAPMTVDTVFDLASLTKPIATATSIMLLIQRGDLHLDDRVSEIIPEFAANAKADVTIQHLLTHVSGLIPDNALKDYEDGPEKAFERIHELALLSPAGTEFRYSDVGFLVLGEVIQRKTGQSVHEFSQQHIFAPLQMKETGYLPPEDLRLRAAVTEKREDRWMQGEVHDPRAYLLQGVAGHAGLFSTADDLSRYARMLLNGGELDGVRILNADTITLMTSGVDVGNGMRSPGWDVRSGYSSNRGDLMSAQAFGHGGFTGTAIWVDPGLDLFVIFLSNRVHPDGSGSVNPLAGRIGTIAAAAVIAADHAVTP
ncbi:MAG: beta-lactamase family protein [Planctomycetaceae bacterium]|nr:beta-lactamase family protein [Planctomycetaceae bacterium]